MPAALHRCVPLVVLAAVMGCDSPAPTSFGVLSAGPSFSMASGDWNEPVHLGPEVNSPSRELGGAISADGLALYFNSDRPLSNGSFDIFVSRRACLGCAWEPARLIGPPISGPGNDGGVALSHDGHLLFFLSDRDGSLGREDLWVSWRADPTDDLAWEDPVNLGPLVNTTGDEGSPSFVAAAPGAPAQLYFNRALETWVVPISRRGDVLGPAERVELGGDARSVSVRKDGLELVFWASSGRGGLGATDIWMSTRHNITEPWGAPVNLGGPVNTTGGELEPGISADGMTLVFSGTMARGSSLGFQDIWIATRNRH